MTKLDSLWSTLSRHFQIDEIHFEQLTPQPTIDYQLTKSQQVVDWHLSQQRLIADSQSIASPLPHAYLVATFEVI